MSGSDKTREELMQTASVLEQILGVMPDDLNSLRTLYETWLKLEDPEKAISVLTRLDDRARALQDAGGIGFVIRQYEPIADAVPEIKSRLARLKELQKHVVAAAEPEAAGAAATGDVPVQPAVVERSKSSSMEAEMALAWDLFQDQQLSQEEYSNVLHDLTEMSSHAVSVPVTVLHVLSDRNFSRFERLMCHLSQKSGVPIISLSQFAENEAVRQELPLGFVSSNGALPFSRIADELLVAVLNPMDKELIRNVSGLTGKRCHPYLVSPHDYDMRLEQVKKAVAAQQASEG